MAEVVTMPKLGFDMAEGTLVRWVKAEGEAVNKGEVLAEIETDKATVEVESSFTGTVLRQLVEQGTSVPVGDPIAVIGEPGEPVDNLLGGASEKEKVEEKLSSTAPSDTKNVAEHVAAQPAMTTGRVIASPLARKMAEENGLDLTKITGTGPGGRIVKQDIETALTAPVPMATALPVSAAAAPVSKSSNVTPPPISWQSGEKVDDQVIVVDRLRAAIGRRMTESKQQLPHFYVTHEYNMEPLMKLRSQVNSLIPEDQKISVNDFIVKAVGLALRQYPNLNSSLKDGQIIRYGQINVGVAVAVGGGLLTIVNRDTDQKPLRLISTEIREMVGRARVGKVRPDDIEGSTFSISNLGMYDVDHFIAIINPPEAAILAVGSAREVPVVSDGEIKPGIRMKATISADHRVTDGAEAAQFMQALARFIEDPLNLLI